MSDELIENTRTSIQLVGCERLILQEIADKRCKRKTVAMTYAFALRSNESIDFKKINLAIIERWSEYALKWIKEQAWSGKCFESRIDR